jgi:hypothetical protein
VKQESMGICVIMWQNCIICSEKTLKNSYYLREDEIREGLVAMKKKKISKADEPDDPEVVLVSEKENEYDDDRFVNVSFKISYKMLMKLDAFAARQRLSRSDVIRYAIEELLKNEGAI